MISNDVCKNLATFHKSDAYEVIDIGDIVMLDPENNTVTKAVNNGFEDLFLNSRLIVGVVVFSDNESKIPILTDGGYSKDIQREIIDCGTSVEKPEFILIEGGTSEQCTREIVQIAYGGEVVVNICGYAQLGDKLTISNHPGKAKAIDYIDNEYFWLRSIGRVVKFINNYQVKVLLDIV